MNSNDISWFNLVLGSLIVVLPVIIFQYYRTGLVRQMLIAFARMSIQLLFVGFYLKYIFALDSIAINLLWIIIMMIAAAISIVRRSELSTKAFIMPVAAGIFADVILNAIIYAYIVMDTDTFLHARYLIPITGMVIGNCITNAIIGIRAFYNNLKDNEIRYRYALIAGATKSEALRPFFADAFRTSFAPTIASNATIGLIWLPGMMTGQILGGSDPMTAIKYQILIVLSIFVGGVITVFTALRLSLKYSIDTRQNLNHSIYKS